MRLGCKVHDNVRTFFFKYLRHLFCISNITMDKLISVFLGVFDVSEILAVPGIGKEIEINDTVFAVFIKPVADEVTPYKSRAAGDEQCCHKRCSL